METDEVRLLPPPHDPHRHHCRHLRFKRALIQIPEGVTYPLREGNDGAYHRPHEGPFIKALEAHVATLKEQLAVAEARQEKQAADFAAREAQHIAELASERAKGAAEISAERARADREAEKAGKAIEAFASLADRLDVLAAERARPWWRHLLRSAG
jgi:hypothetical protein